MAVERAEQITRPEDVPAAPAPAIHYERQPRRLFDVDEYYRMAEVGILKPDERVELIEGEILNMSPIGRRHVAALIALNRVFTVRLIDVAEVSIRSPVRLRRRVEPEPDVAILRLRPDEPFPYASAHPGPEDVLLIVEVAWSSLTYDLGEKAGMYARYGVPELWVVDLTQDRLIIHREPTADGYASVVELPRGESISPILFPDVSFTADEILGAPLPEGVSPDDLDDEAVGDQ
jgi:Uma2 family endonuclease